MAQSVEKIGLKAWIINGLYDPNYTKRLQNAEFYDYDDRFRLLLFAF